MIKKIKSDLIFLSLKGRFDVIVHGCNCMCTMGAGIAKQIKLHFPKAWEVDKRTKRGDKSKLGNYTKADIILQIPDGKGYKNQDLVVINAYTQYDYKWHNNEPPVDLMAIEEVFTKINYDFKGKKVGIPLIGSGLAGGDWDLIQSIIERVTPDIDLTIVEWHGFFEG
jgi:O-acetyl-ADP-ribose deacetylase (regulator of RNase III)